MLSLETQWHFGIDAWVGHVYHTDTRLAVVFMSNCLLVVVTSHGWLSLVMARMFVVYCFQGADEAQS
jgi:hypothetical protein